MDDNDANQSWVDSEWEEAERTLEAAQREIDAYHTQRNEGMQQMAEESREWLLENQDQMRVWGYQGG